jgi:hypothetical protein
MQSLLTHRCGERGSRETSTEIKVQLPMGLLGSGTVQLTAWEAYVSARAQLAQSEQRRWSHFLSNLKISPLGLYLLLPRGR